MAFMGDGIMSGKHDDNISPYLRRPLRSLVAYLREAAQRRKQQQDQVPQIDRRQGTKKEDAGTTSEEE